MLKRTTQQILKLENDYPGISETIHEFESAKTPPCTHCKSDHTAQVQTGVIQRTISIAFSTTKFKLVPNGPRPGSHFCNDCERFFDSDS